MREGRCPGPPEATQCEKADVQDHPEATQGKKAVAQAHPEATQGERVVAQPPRSCPSRDGSCPGPPGISQGEKTPTLNKQTPDDDEEAPTPHTSSPTQGQLVALRGQGPGQQVQLQCADEENLPQWRDSHADFSLHGDGGNMLHRLNALTLHSLFTDQIKLQNTNSSMAMIS